MFLLNCDSTTNPQSVVSEQPFVQSIEVSPSVVQFSLVEDGYKDTTITFEIDTSVLNATSTLTANYVVTNLSDRSIKDSGSLSTLTADIPESNTEPLSFTASFELSTSTTQFNSYMIQVIVFDESGSTNTAEQAIELRGFSNSRPQILEVNNPEEINRPASGEILTFFTAKVTDQDGQNTIDRVLVRILDILGSEVPDSPFEMFDDGLTFNDAVASDSVYTITFPIAAIADRSTQQFFIEYFAVDQGGIYSDTTKTTFRITNNQ